MPLRYRRNALPESAGVDSILNGTLLAASFSMRVNKILIAVDESSLAGAIADYGFGVASALDAEVGISMILDPQLAYAPEGGIPAAEILASMRLEAEGTLSRLLQNRDPGSIKKFIEEGKPGARISAIAKEWGADIIIMGSRGRSGIERVLIGSVAEYIMRHAPCPVLVIPKIYIESRIREIPASSDLILDIESA